MTKRTANYHCLRAKTIQLQLKKAKDKMVCGPSMEVQIYLTLLPLNHMGNYAIATFAIIGSGHTVLADQMERIAKKYNKRVVLPVLRQTPLLFIGHHTCAFCFLHTKSHHAKEEVNICT